MSNFQPTPRKKNALDNAALRLYAPNAAGKSASLSISLRKNGADVTVWTNEPNDTKDNGKISANLTLPYFFTMIEMLKMAARTQGYKKFIEVKSYIFPGGKRSEQPVVTARILIGREEDGTVYISVTANGRPNVKFVTVPGGFNSIRNADSSEVSVGELSQLYAAGWASILERTMAHLAVVEYVEPQPKQQGGGGGGWGGNRNNGGGNGGGNNWNNNNGGGGGNSGGNGGGGQSSTDLDSFEGW